MHLLHSSAFICTVFSSPLGERMWCELGAPRRASPCRPAPRRRRRARCSARGTAPAAAAPGAWCPTTRLRALSVLATHRHATNRTGCHHHAGHVHCSECACEPSRVYCCCQGRESDPASALSMYSTRPPYPTLGAHAAPQTALCDRQVQRHVVPERPVKIHKRRVNGSRLKAL